MYVRTLSNVKFLGQKPSQNMQRRKFLGCVLWKQQKRTNDDPLQHIIIIPDSHFTSHANGWLFMNQKFLFMYICYYYYFITYLVQVILLHEDERRTRMNVIFWIAPKFEMFMSKVFHSKVWPLS